MKRKRWKEKKRRGGKKKKERKEAGERGMELAKDHAERRTEEGRGVERKEGGKQLREGKKGRGRKGKKGSCLRNREGISKGASLKSKGRRKERRIEMNGEKTGRKDVGRKKV